MTAFVTLWAVVLVVLAAWYLRTKRRIRHDDAVLRDRYRQADRSDRIERDRP